MGQAGVSVKILYNRSNSFGLTAKDEADAHVYCTNMPRYIHRWTEIFFVMIPPPLNWVGFYVTTKWPSHGGLWTTKHESLVWKKRFPLGPAHLRLLFLRRGFEESLCLLCSIAWQYVIILRRIHAKIFFFMFVHDSDVPALTHHSVFYEDLCLKCS